MKSLDSDELRREAGLPPLIFMFTLDQISAMVSIDETELRSRYLYYAGRSVGVETSDVMYAINVAPPDMPAEWRVSHREFVRWLRRKGIRSYDLTRVAKAVP